MKGWDGDLEKQKNNDNQTPKPTTTSETFTPQPSKLLIDRYGNQISVSSEEEQEEETFEDSLDDIM